MAFPLGKEKRHIPRIEGLGRPLVCVINERHSYPRARLCDLALDSLRFEVGENFPGALESRAPVDFVGHVTDLGLYLTCRSRVVRTYETRDRDASVRGVALRFEDLDPAARAQIRALYPPSVRWPEAMA
jgi:hypothetical protein